jgi:uncharacterized membrane protein YccC
LQRCRFLKGRRDRTIGYFLLSDSLLSPFPDIFSNLRVRYGIKLSLAALLSLYVALVLRLEHPNWAVLTALVMMNSHYVSAYR